MRKTDDGRHRSVKAAEHEAIFVADDASVARVETTRPPGTLPNIVCRALVHGETATWTADPEAGR